MNTTQTSTQGCGGTGTCGCGAKAGNAAASTPAPMVAAINGIALHAPGQDLPPQELRERAYTELLRQQAVRAGLLPRKAVLTAVQPDDQERAVLESMVDAAVQVPQPTAEECQRYFAARRSQFTVGRAVHMRHILFAVTAGVNVQALTVHAEKALISLLGKDVPLDLFGKLAAELSNCPTGSQGGDLGWVGPDDCAPELAQLLFFQTETPVGLGVQPRLIHSRYGFHIIDVLERREGRTLAYDEVQDRVAALLTLQSRAKALHQYMSILVGQALVEGVELDAADSPLVQ
jgi:peptidyl-prolyl cis-trans isomerase C